MTDNGTDAGSQPGSSAPKSWLKEGHSLIERDMLPVVMRAQATEAADVGTLASVSKRFPLETYDSEDLGKEVKKLTGYDVKVGKTQMLKNVIILL